MPASLPAAARPWIAAVLVAACAGWGAERAEAAAPLEHGKASVYHDKYDGRVTASGQRFSQKRLTAAHRSLPFGTRVKAVNLANGRSVEVEITDRGPFVDGRVIDLSRKAADAIGMRDLAKVVLLTD